MSNIDATLAERGSRYGEFDEHASITQGIKDAMKTGRNWDDLDDDMKECLEMVAHKTGRILNGDPKYIDSWTDIIGYARLVEKRLIAEQTKEETSNYISVAEALGKLLCDRPKKTPTVADVEAALNTLLDAGAIAPAN